MNKEAKATGENFMRGMLLRWALLFVVLFPLSFPFERGGIIPDPGKYTQHFFENLARFTGDRILHLDPGYSSLLVSDTTGFYLNALNLLVMGMAGALVWSLLARQRSNYHLLSFWLVIIIRYYLALQMCWYGFDKIFKVQFYQPEPNTLFTPLGYTQRDLLYWSTIGSSYTYTFFAGLTELLAAALLLFHRTHLLGILFASGIMINVLMINIGFDISVKLYSFFLLFLCMTVLALHLKSLYGFFVRHVPVKQHLWRPAFLSAKKAGYMMVKPLVIVILLADALWPFVRSGNYNDDVFPRPLFHGAYQVEKFRVNSSEMEACLDNGQRWKRFFIHRRGYFIVQYMNDEMHDFELAYNITEQQLVLTNYDSVSHALDYVQEKGRLTLYGIIGKDTLHVKATRLDLEKLPLLKNEFGWTINE